MRRFFVFFIMMQSAFNLLALTESVNGITLIYTVSGDESVIGNGSNAGKLNAHSVAWKSVYERVS